jgi:UDP-N-acetylglucosamine--N-acetylmuramyl-(pentapeptide) pyrophosphoryl-undecaprenol N-acetylglucosamine transferase
LTTVLVASTGGHLAQLFELRPRLIPPSDDVLWVTFDTPQSRSLLAAERVQYVPYIAPRDWKTAMRNVPLAREILRAVPVDAVYSTGSAIAVSFLPLASMMGIECHYIESAARSVGPSMTGRLMAHTPGVATHTQYACWADDKWSLTASVFDSFVADDEKAAGDVRSLVVTLGTIEGYGFRALVERILEIAPPGVDIFWQTGVTDVSSLPIDARATVPQADLMLRISVADAVIAHAGIGSALGALRQGVVPLLVPRRVSRREHVDDHQVQIARELSMRRLAIHREVESLTWADVVESTQRRVAPVDLARAFAS